MGIEEYRFLTNTMEQITDYSGRLESVKNELIKEQDLLRSLRLNLEGANRRENIHIKDIQKWEDKVRTHKNKTSKLPSLKALEEAKNKIDPTGRESKFEGTRISVDLLDDSFLRLYGIFVALWFMWMLFGGILFSPSTTFSSKYPQIDGLFSVFWDTPESCCLGLVVMPAILAVLVAVFQNHSSEKRSEQAKAMRDEMAPIDRQISSIHKLQAAKRKLSELKRATAIDLEIKKVGKKIAGKENAVAGLKNRISSLEKQILANWNSIAHLIPYSFALEKA